MADLEGNKVLAIDSKMKDNASFSEPQHASSHTTDNNPTVNASGHVQELERNYSLLSLAGLGLIVGNVWPAIGGSILVAIFNGGPPGVLYEFLAVSLCYWTVASSIAELASAVPSSAGVYHWASITPGPKLGRVVGFYAGWWNFLAWTLGCASMSSIFANTVVQMYQLGHPDLVIQSWHIFIAFLLTTWAACALVCLANNAIPLFNKVGVFFILGSFIVTVVVMAVMPSLGGRPGYATSAFVWKDWKVDPNIGYSDGFVFVAGMLNGAYSVGAVDATTHLAEEIPRPERNVPIAIALQVVIGFATGFCYLVVIMYAINDYDALFASSFPIAEIYRQGTNSTVGAIGLLSLILVCIGLTVVGLYVTCGRTLWALARDGATPFPKVLGSVNHRLHMPLWATLITGVLVTILACIYLGSQQAFSALVGSFVLASSSSFLAAILPNLLTGRKNIVYGSFHMRGWIGFVVNGVSCAYMLVWFVIYSFPASLPTSAAAMNWAPVIWVAATLLVTIWWFVGAGKDYKGPVTTGGVVTIDGI
ncbi:amino acid permease [Colletotrichum karsti]|uniref:Amino acid permease n=1 Tax=Colletotrichum karsti TaxID=1095194 RepID=A0A9P6LJY8_9PEZI|nr:amino acid permease [Colletotrichum karsti]KAF9875445.1 amino acid permease [Colletotrichum karsti]